MLYRAAKNYRFETVHEGFFARLPKWGREIFLGLRYVVKVADTGSLEAEKLKEWREALLFSWTPRVPIQYRITEEAVEIVITFLFSLIQRHNFIYPARADRRGS